MVEETFSASGAEVTRPQNPRTTVKLRLVGEESYASDSGYTLRREQGRTPNGNPVGGRWVLRDGEGAWVDMDQYRHDLAERWGFSIN